jgi:prepilin peptidase CpaA
MHAGLLEAVGPLIIVLLGLAAWSDLAIRTIPDWICIALAFAGLLIRGSVGLDALAVSIGLAAVLFLALATLHAHGALGGGDVKLAAALVLGLPLSGAYRFLTVTVLAGGVLGLLYLALRQLPAPLPCPAGASRLRRVWTAERWRIRRKGSLPYGIAIACGGVAALLSGIGG